MAYLVLSAVGVVSIAFAVYVWLTMAHGRKRATPQLTISDIVAPGDLRAGR